jgi:hypothetical protein
VAVIPTSATSGVSIAPVFVDTAEAMRGTDSALTALPAAPTDWLSAAAVAAAAVTKIQAGLSTYAGGAVASVSGSVGSVASYGTLVGDIATAVWAVATSALTGAGSIGKRVVDFVTTLVYEAPPAAAPDIAPLAANIVKVKAAVYDSATVAANVATLSNGATVEMDVDGNRTTTEP